MGHGFRFSLDRRFIIDKSQMHFCELEEPEEPYPKCAKLHYCGPITRLFCLFWDIFDFNIEFMDKERKKQKRLDDFQVIGVAAVGRKAIERNLGIMNRSEEPSVVISGPIMQVDILGYLAEKEKRDKKDAKKLKKLRGINSKSKKGSKNPNSRRYKR
jgi:hypothetical protein